MRNLVGLVLFALFFAIIHASGLFSGLTKPLTNGLQSLAVPFYSLGVDAIDASTPKLPAGQAATKARIESLSIENAKLRVLAEENLVLKAALKYEGEHEDALLLTRVISTSHDPIRHMLLIDKGGDDGVTVGQAAIVSGGVIVGKVAEVSHNTALIKLLSDSTSALAVSIQNTSGTLGVLEGNRGLSLSIELIPQTEPVIPGEVVITSGAEPGIRRGLVVGTIERVRTTMQDPFQSAVVVPFSEAERPIYIHLLRPAPTALDDTYILVP